MNSVEGIPPRIGAAPARAAPQPAASRAGGDAPASAPSAAAVTPSPAAGTPEGGLMALLNQARIAQAQLASQPLPITNHHSRLVTKLFGG